MTTDTSAEALERAAYHLEVDALVYGGDLVVTRREKLAATLRALAAEKRRTREGMTDDLVWEFIRAAKSAGAEEDASENGMFWCVEYSHIRAALEAVWPDGRDAKDECLKCGAAIDEEYGHVGECIDVAMKDTDYEKKVPQAQAQER